MNDDIQYRFLEPRPGSNYRSLFVKGRRLRAELLYRQTLGEEPRTPEDIARDYDLPLEVVQEAIRYSIENADFLRQEHEREEARWNAYEKEHPTAKPTAPIAK